MTRTGSQFFLWRFSKRANECVVAIGLAVLLGWLLDLPFLRGWTRELIAMNPLSAVLFILCGVKSICAAEI